MDLSDSENFLRKIYYAYIREPLMKIKERWLAYFAEFMIDEGPSTSDAESEIHSSMEVIPKNVLRAGGGTCDKSEYQLSRFNFIVTLFGTVFGFSNLWYLPDRIVNVATPVPYLIIFLFITLAFYSILFFVHLSMGQYTSSTAIAFFHKVPLIQGVGYSLLVYTFILTFQYGQVMAHTGFLYSASFKSILPWSQCPEGRYLELNITKCGPKSDMMDIQCPRRKVTFNATEFCLSKDLQSKMEDKCCRDTSDCNLDAYLTCNAWTYPVYYYSYANYSRLNLGKYRYLDELGPPDFTILIYFGAVWFLTFIFSSIDQKWSRMVILIVYPCIFICLLIILPFALKLDGTNFKGLFRLKYTHFINHDTWGRAFNDAAHSFGIITVTIFFLGSLSRFRSPCHMDTILVLLATILFASISTLIIVSIANHINSKSTFYFVYKNPSTILLIFHILSLSPVPWLPTIGFFSLILIAGIVHLSGMVVSMSATIADVANIRVKDRPIVSFVLTFSLYLLSVPYIYKGSYEIFDLIHCGMERYGPSLCCIMEFFALLIYGVGLFCENISFMLGFYPNRLFRYLFIIAPFAIIPIAVNFLFGSRRFFSTKYYDHENWPILRMGSDLSIFVPTALGIVVAILVYTFKLDLLGIVRVSPKLGPKNEELKIQREAYRTKRRIL